MWRKVGGVKDTVFSVLLVLGALHPREGGCHSTEQLLHVVASLCTRLNEHDVEVVCPSLSLLHRYLSLVLRPSDTLQQVTIFHSLGCYRQSNPGNISLRQIKVFAYSGIAFWKLWKGEKRRLQTRTFHRAKQPCHEALKFANTHTHTHNYGESIIPVSQFCSPRAW